MAKVTIRRLTSRGDEALAVEPSQLAQILPEALRNGAAAVRTERAGALFVGSDPVLVQTLVRNEIAAGAERVEVIVVPRIAGG